SPGENDTTVDAGFYKTAALGDFVFNDANNNGIQDTGEVGVGGVTVTLTGGGADGIINGIGDTTVTTTTNASGNYNFAGLTPGQQYRVGFSGLPAGFQFTQANVGANDAVDSDANPSTGQTQIVTLVSGENNLTLDAGIYQNIGDLSITKTDGLTTVIPGQQITYTIVARNNGLITATNALVSDIIPSNLTNVTWTSVASGGATDNQTSGTGNINDYVTLTAGSSITYTVTGTVAPSPVSTGSRTTFDFDGNSALDGTDGNTRTFTKDGITVTARAFSRVDGTNGAWSAAYLGSYGGGLGVTDSSEGNGGNNTHVVDNVGGRDNYVLFQFSEAVVLDRAYLQYVLNDSDISVWIGNFSNPPTTLSDSILSSFGFTEVNETTSTSDRWADVNAGNYVGNTIVIAASDKETSPEDQFKIRHLDVLKVTPASLVNTATITAPTGFTDTNSNNNSATDTNTIVTPSTVKVGDRVWYDTNGNGVQDTGESGVSGVTVKLFNQAGAQIGTTTTDANGLYQFNVNANSTYSVQFVEPTGFNGFTTANVGNDAADSDVVNTNGTTAQFSVGTTDNLTIDAGLIKNIGDLSITKTDGLTTVIPGQQITYTIVARNNGLITATNALVSDIIPSNLTNVTWTSVASGGATDNQTSGTGNINDYVTLTAGSSITYTVTGTVAPSPVSTGSRTTFDFDGNSALDGTDGNTRTFTKDGITVTARAFSRVDGTNGAWSAAYLGSYGGGLGVTDSSEGNGGNNTHVVDNVGGRDNYVLFQFSEAVVLDQAYLQYVIKDSDISVWIGNFSSPPTTLSDSILNSFGFYEANVTTSTSDRWADVNAGKYVGNTIVIAALDTDTSPEDQFKIRHLDVLKVTPASLVNTATITAPTGFTDTNSNNNSATDTDTVIAAPGVRTPGFWANTEWQKFWDGVQGNEPTQKTLANFADSDLLFPSYTNSAQSGKVLDPVTGQYSAGLLIGDYNRNGITDTGEDTIFYTLSQARQIVDASAHPNGDVRYDLGRSLVASWLNYLAGNPIDTAASTTDQDARYYINEGINWLQAVTPDENADKKGDGALNQLTGSSVNSPRIDNYWSQGISSASNLPSPYNSNTKVTYGLDAGSFITSKLDEYNNGLGLADHVFYGGNA
ncbi:SdrD B-like domain-containing protein, partial [Aulosira sp. FACHB-615]